MVVAARRPERARAPFGGLAPVAALALALAALLAPGAAPAQPPPAAQPAPAPSGPAAEELRAALEALEAEGAELARVAADWDARAAEYAQARRDAPTRLRALEREIAALREAGAPRVPEQASAGEVETSLLAAEQELALARREAMELESETAGRDERRRQIPELLAAAKERLRTREGAPAPAGEDARLLAARAKVAQARRQALLAEIEALEQELASYEARGGLLARRLDRAQLRVAQMQARVEALRDALLARESREAEQAAERARGLLEETAALAPAVQGVVRRLAEQNAELAAQRTGTEGLVGRIDDVSRKLANAEESVARVEADRARLTRKVGAAGLSGSLGLLLRKQRADAPDVGKYRRFIRMRRDLIREAQVRQIELREERRGLADVEALVARTMSGVDAELPAAERAAIESLLRDLLETKRRYLDALIADYETYFQKLVDFDAKQQELITRTEELLRFIDERILWIPSGAVLRPGLSADVRAAFAWLLDGRFWEQFGRALVSVLAATPLQNTTIALAALCLVALGGRARARIRVLGDEARDPGCTRWVPTAEALGLSLLLVPSLPGLLAFLGWRVEASPLATLFARCVGGAMVATGVVWATLEVPRQILCRGGLAEAHLRWPEEAVRRLRRDLGWLTAAALPLVFLIQVLELRDEDAWKESVGRFAFALLMGLLAFVTHRWMRRAGPIAQIARAGSHSRWRLLHAAAVAVPLLLGAAALGGYYWTALRLAARWHWTLCFVFGLVVLVGLAARWSLLARRRLAIERARERAAARAAARAQGADAPAEEAEEPLDLAAVDAQAGRLLQGSAVVAGLLGLWLIWAEVLPAAGILREVSLWNTTETVTVASTTAAGEPRTTTEQRVVPVTLADLLAAALVAALTLLLVRNLPGLLELSLFRNVRFGPGERYAYATIVKYGIGAGGALLAGKTLGMNWSSVQWLAAAVGIGLGFGLQEIFANFISGLILLFERPIRVGDTVTIGDVTGTVTRIRIRSTWIMGGDRKEHVVPNKQFVTSQLVNWSHADTVLRVDLRVGIAYGSDVEQALAILRDVALRNEHVLREPRPEAWFVRFGESSIDLELSAFSPDAAHVTPIRHALHLAIDRTFREAGIEIAFPQREVHLRTSPPPAAEPKPAGGDSR